MRYLIIASLLLLDIESPAQSVNRQQLRNLFVSATERKPALDSLMSLLERIEKKSPAEESYFGICNGLYCQYETSDWAKLKHVMKSRSYLNSAIARDAKDPELRFMRFMLEHFLPSFLGLNKHMADDLQVVFKNPSFIDDNLLLKRKVVEFLLWTKRCTPEQSKMLQKEMQELDKNRAEVQCKSGGG
jgi:hypothetical protein